MPSEKQVTNWVERALRLHLSIDVVAMHKTEDGALLVTTRKLGTTNEPGDEFLITVARAASGQETCHD